MPDQLSSDLASLRIQRDEDPDRRKPLWTALIALAAVGALGGVVAVAYPRLEAQIFKTEVSTTEIAMVSPVQSSITLTSSGYVVAQKSSMVGAKSPGRIAKVAVKEGDVVKAGDLIAELESAGPKSAIAAVRARVGAARARATAARANVAEVAQQVERQRALVATGAAAKAQLDDLVARMTALEAAAKAADAEVYATQAEAGALEVELADRTIVAPIDGTIVSKPLEVGELVGAQTESIVEIADFSSLLVETDVPEGRVHMVKVGTPSEIVLDAYPTVRHRGKVVEIGKRVNRAKATLMVKVAFVDVAEGVLPEMSARTSFLTEELDKAAMKEAPKRVVPSSAVVERAGAKMVFTVDQGQIRAVPVKLGEAMGAGFELLEGPAEGTRIVADPSSELSDGQKIKEKGAE